MAKTTTTPPAAGQAHVPVHVAVGWAQTNAGYTIYRVTFQGSRVLAHEIVEGPLSKSQAQEALKIAVARTFFLAPKKTE